VDDTFSWSRFVDWAAGLGHTVVAWLQSILQFVAEFILSIGEKVLQALTFFLAWLVDMAVALFSWLPDHRPLALPDPASVGQVLSILGVYARWVHWPFVLAIFVLIIVYKGTILLYGAYRAVLGLIPMFK
jgi:hypothetical protein